MHCLPRSVPVAVAAALLCAQSITRIIRPPGARLQHDKAHGICSKVGVGQLREGKVLQQHRVCWQRRPVLVVAVFLRVLCALQHQLEHLLVSVHCAAQRAAQAQQHERDILSASVAVAMCAQGEGWHPSLWGATLLRCALHA